MSHGEADHEPTRCWENRLLILLAILLAIFSAIPLGNELAGKPNKDYSLWYQVGVAIRDGWNIYPDPAQGRLFPFMYPPPAAAILGVVSQLGRFGTTLALVLAHSVAWVASIALSIWLTTGGRIRGQNPWLYVAPSLCIIPLIHNTYLLGQPNLALLALLLGAFALLQRGKGVWAGVLIATAAAIKAFPILVLGYLAYRRLGRALAATLAALAVWLLVVPLPFRTQSQAVSDLLVWSRGMLFTYNAQGIAQRPYRSLSYKNQSIMAMAHRLLRDVPADGEKVLAEHVAAKQGGRPPGGLRPDGTINLAEMLRPTAPTPRWDELFDGAEESLARAWRVNFLHLGFRSVTLITLLSMLGLSVFVAAALPSRQQRTLRTDPLEFALVTLLVVLFSPLSFNYAFVWLLFPYTVALHLTLADPLPGRWQTVERLWVGAALLIPAFAVFMPLVAQAYGNLFFPAMMLVLGLGVRLRMMSQTAAPPRPARQALVASWTTGPAGARTSLE